MGKATLSKAEVRASRLNIWKMKPMVRERRMAPWSSERPETSWPSRWYLPEVGLSKSPKICIRVDLPEPEGPMMATNSPSSMLRSIPLRTLSSLPPTW